MNGVSGIVAPLIVGVLRTIQLSTDKITDIVPVDYTANALISVMWDTVNRYGYYILLYVLLHVPICMQRNKLSCVFYFFSLIDIEMATKKIRNQKFIITCLVWKAQYIGT